MEYRIPLLRRRGSVPRVSLVININSVFQKKP